MSASPVEYTIGGVKIQFPCKAYPSQLAMMNSILRGLNYGQHCLLESPTGSGKSLALLCSALGWQQAQIVKQDQEEASGSKCNPDENSKDYKSDVANPCQCVCHSKVSRPSPAVAAKSDAIDLTDSPCKEEPSVTASCSAEVKPQNVLKDSSLPTKSHYFLNSDQDDDDDDFKPNKKRIRSAERKSFKRKQPARGVVFEENEPEMENQHFGFKSSTAEPNSHTADLFTSPSLQECFKCSCASTKDSVKDKEGKKKIPKIFFGTRTHKQITQIAHELKRTFYSGIPMTILSSRDHTCVNRDVAPHSNRNERCKELLEAKDGRSCRYYHGVQKMRDQRSLQWVHGLHQAWDIEDLVSLGKRLHSCSYYAARELMQDAYIIFCPYNYLLDPLIRESMEIDLAGQIVVLDEAHNIEDCARESASYTLDQNNLLMCRDELDSMINNNIRPSKHEPLRDLCYSLYNWIMTSQTEMSEYEYEKSSKVWNGKNVLSIFHNLGITTESLKMLKQNLLAVLEKEERAGFVNGADDTVQVPTISSPTATVLKSLLMVLDFMFRDNCRFAEDYRVALQKSYAWTNKAGPDIPDAHGFFSRPQSRRRQSIKVKTEVLTLSFWCLNPAVTFSDLSGAAHSIVLTSGTLSPMGSFSSELGVKFSIQLEANHVINKSQVWVGTVGAGPLGKILRATFQHAETYAFQDEVGALLLHVCSVVAKGVLCFLPSYKMLDKLRDRWISTGLWEKLEEQKTVITEPRGGGKGDFDELLQTYYDAIKCCERRDGALLVAVCRGKVSEGLDFTDDNARAVVTIGIPFPNIKDLQVDLKMKYNDQHCKTRGLLPGNRWYEIQAYRALNQALGRCIRHRNDWGALILVDDRYGKNPNKYITGLSKWVRQLVQHHDTFSNAMQSLGAFSQAQLKWIPESQNSQLSATEESQSLSRVQEPHETHQDKSSPNLWVSDTKVKAERNDQTNPFLTEQSSAPHLYSNAHPISEQLKKPIFKEGHRNCSQHLETYNFLECTGERQTSSPPKKKKKGEDFGLTCAVGGLSSEIKEEPCSLVAESCTVATPPRHEGEMPSGASPKKEEEEEDEDQSIFFTPELFMDEEEEGSPKCETPSTVTSKAE